MKTLRFIPVLFLLFSALGLKSQEIPPPNPGLVISIVSGQIIEFHFNEFSEYQNGIPNTNEDTYIRIGAIYDWKLQFRANQAMFYGQFNPTHQMELNNVGVVVVSTGTNQDNGTNIVNNAKTAPMALQATDQTLMTKGALTNKGYGIENSFILNWEMGTMTPPHMNPVSILEQMIPADIYTVNIVLTLSVY